MADQVASQEARPVFHRKLRLTFLFSLLGVLIVAVVYDYRISRPSVESAYDMISELNARMNTTPTAPPTKSQHIQAALQRAPDNITRIGPYTVEVFKFTAGLPFRSHDYYAVYLGAGTRMAFVRHYKFYLPEEELRPKPIRVVARVEREPDAESVRDFMMKSMERNQANMPEEVREQWRERIETSLDRWAEGERSAELDDGARRNGEKQAAGSQEQSDAQAASGDSADVGD